MAVLAVGRVGGRLPRRGLNRSLPKDWDLETMVSSPQGQEISDSTYLNDMPYCETCSYPAFQTKVTSHALVA